MRAETDDDNDFVDPYLVFHVADAAEPLPDEGGWECGCEEEG
jgi:hypothetical protein